MVASQKLGGRVFVKSLLVYSVWECEMEYLVGQHVVILIFPLFLLAVYRLMEISSIHRESGKISTLI